MVFCHSLHRVGKALEAVGTSAAIADAASATSQAADFILGLPPDGRIDRDPE